MDLCPTKMLAASRLLLMPEHQSQACLEEKLSEISEQFLWLKEIRGEAIRMFSEKSVKLEQLPKTPSMKRGRKRVRNGLKKANENEEASSPVTRNLIPTKVNFDMKSENDDTDKEELEVSQAGRPLRNCRQRSKVTQKEEPVKRSTRQSRKPTKQNAAAETQGDKTKPEDLIENVSPADTLRKAVDEDTAEPKAVAKVSSKKKITTSVSVDQCEEKSPSVKDRAIAYECMIKKSSANSPMKPSRLGTPRTPNGSTADTKVDSAKCKGVIEKNSGSKKLSGSLHSKTGHGQTDSPSKERGSNSKERPSTADNGGRPVRTRLRLNKKCQEADVPTLTESVARSPQSMDQECSPRKRKMSENNKENEKLEDIDMVDDGNQQQEENMQTGQQENKADMDETQIMVTEVYEIEDKCQPAKLKEYEMVKIKTTPVGEAAKPQTNSLQVIQNSETASSSGQGFTDEHSENERFEEAGVAQNMNGTFTKEAVEMETQDVDGGRATRTRTRAMQRESQAANKTKGGKGSGVDIGVEDVPTKSDATFTRDKPASLESGRNTRTRTRKQMESSTSDAVENEGPRTRTRQRKQDGKADVKPNGENEPKTQVSPVEELSNDVNKLAVRGSDDEVIAGSPAMRALQSCVKGGKKRLVEERGLSPRPKRQRSVSAASPLSASSPIKKQGEADEQPNGHEERDVLLSPVRNSRAFKFNSAQKATSGFMNRTPGFRQNTNKLYSFLNTTPTCHNGSVLTFLKRNTPPAIQSVQAIQELKKQKLLEKESRDRERLKKTEEMRKRKIEELRRQRQDKERKVAEAREMKQRMELEQKEKINRKFEDKDKVKEKLMEERCREEREKQKLRMRKQMEADARRKQEEEDRLRKRIEMEEEARMQEEFMQRKKDFEEAERKRLIAEEKKKQEERLTDLEQKRQEEKARLKKAEEERQKERERLRLEKERQAALEKAERDRMERERREEKERKLREDLEKLKAMEKERLRRQEEEAQKRQQEEIQKNELKDMIQKHNTAIKKPPSATNLSTTFNSSKQNLNSYDLTPVKVKVASAKTVNTEDYGLDDKGSDDSTDDDEAPKKKIPEWAMGIPLKTALIKQHHNPPDLEAIFRTSCIEPPDLTVLFPGKKNRRYKERTSSAIWTSPIMKQW